MDRRDVLKALAALPLTAALSGCEEKKPIEKPATNKLEIHLEGGFAVVVQENNGNSVLAFSPRPPKTEEPHQLYFNGINKLEGLTKSHSFKLALEERMRVEKPEVNLGLKDFTFNTEHWRVGDSIVTLELPAPDRITFAGQRTPVKFSSDHRLAFMPTNHILEYDVKDATKHKLECSEKSILCEPSKDSFPGVTRFFFEIGPTHSLDPAKSHAHAVVFFNYILRQSFPDLVERFSLEQERGDQNASSPTSPRVAPAVYQDGIDNAWLQRASYTIDCEFGGLLANTHTAPTKP
jgi:hypothetical protein